MRDCLHFVSDSRSALIKPLMALPACRILDLLLQDRPELQFAFLSEDGMQSLALLCSTCDDPIICKASSIVMTTISPQVSAFFRSKNSAKKENPVSLLKGESIHRAPYSQSPTHYSIQTPAAAVAAVGGFGWINSTNFQVLSRCAGPLTNHVPSAKRARCSPKRCDPSTISTQPHHPEDNTNDNREPSRSDDPPPAPPNSGFRASSTRKSRRQRADFTESELKNLREGVAK